MRVFETYSLLMEYINENYDNNKVLKNTLSKITINGELLYSYLGIYDNDKYLVFDSFQKDLLLMIQPIDYEKDLNKNQIWNWNIVYILINNTNDLLEYNNLEHNSIECFYKILENKTDWNRFSYQLQENSKINKHIRDKEQLENAIDTAYKLIIVGNYLKQDNKYDTITDGNYLNTLDIRQILLDIYNRMLSVSKKGNNKLLLFSYLNMTASNLGTSVDNLSITELLEFGLLDKLNSLFNSFNIYYLENDLLENQMDIWIEW